MVNINLTLEDNDKARKEKTGLTWAEIIELGLRSAELGETKKIDIVK